MLKQMASLAFFIKKFGARQGRKEYNAYHKKYRKLNRKKLALYQRNRRASKKQVFKPLPRHRIVHRPNPCKVMTAGYD